VVQPIAGKPTGAITASRRAIAAACVGNATEWYDFAIYGALATIIGVVYFPTGNPTVALSAAFAAYGTALIVRPLGALVFGRLGDSRGRRSVLVWVIFLMAGATAAVAFLPGYAMIGLLAPLVLMLLRTIQGLAAGGELGVAAVFMLEHAQSTTRGRTGAWHTATMGVGIGCGMAVAAVLGFLFRESGPESGWWRIPFLIALPLGLIGVLLRRRISDPEQFLALRAGPGPVENPVKQLWNHHRIGLIRGFCLLAAGSLGFNTFFIFMPNHLIAFTSAELAPTLLATAASLGIAAIVALGLGRLSDGVGRRPVVIGSAVALAVLAPPMSLLAAGGSVLGLFVAQVVVSIGVAGVLSIAMVGELFAAPVRSTGFALSAGLATALIGGTAPWVDQMLVNLSDADVAPGIYVAVVALVALFVLRRWPETAFRPLS
jgi:MHS family proline/betaine transporter-like MFS transporter